MPILLNWLKKESPDVLCIQETKVQDHEFPSQPLEDVGYHCSFKGQKSYNGVAILSKKKPNNISTGFGDGDEKEGPRLIRLSIDDIVIVNTYIPQGQDPASEKFDYKIEWFSRLGRYFESNLEPTSRVIWAGDFNVAPTPVDVYDPDKLLGNVCYHPKEHKALKEIMGWGFVDVFRMHKPEEKAFTFWDYRIPNAVKRNLGWRVDHICATRCLAEVSETAWIDVEPRLLQKPSDHTFIIAKFDI